jgi:hypothetical protein
VMDGEVFFRVCPWTDVEKIQQAYCEKQNIASQQHAFLLYGQRWLLGKTVAWHGIVDGDVVDCLCQQTGC